MVKRALTLLTSILIALHLLMPFNIYADTITNSNVLGINTVLLSKSQNVAVTNNWYYVYQHTITLDADYIGTITLDVNLTYYAPYGSSSSYNTSTISNKKYFVNGNTITINQTVTTDNFANQGPFVSSSYLLKGSNVVKTSTITELQQIIDILNDLYNSQDQVEGLLNNQLSQLQLVVSNTSLANQYLDVISKVRQYNIPFESYNVIFYNIKNNLNRIVDLYNYGYFQYPIFKYNVNDIVYRSWFLANTEYTFIIMSLDVSLINANEFKSLFDVGDLVISNFSNISFGGGYSVCKMTLKSSTSENKNIISKSADRKYVPLYFYESTYKNISTDFALSFGLRNEVLDNLNIIANGTSASNSASQSSNNVNSQLQTESNTLFQQENGFRSDMQSAMQNVNNTFRLQDMGTKFVSSAQWVRTQYERLTNNTPFSSLITFSLITGLALILLGKIYR